MLLMNFTSDGEYHGDPFMGQVSSIKDLHEFPLVIA